MAQIKKDTSLRKAILQAAITGQLISDIGGESLPLAAAGKPSSATPSPRGYAPKTPNEFASFENQNSVSERSERPTLPETGKQLLDRIIEERNNKLLADWEEKQTDLFASNDAHSKNAKTVRSEQIRLSKKIKKPEPIVASEIDEDEIPFEIPENWCWCKVKDIAEVFGRIGFRGYTTNDLVMKGNGAITISPSNLLENGITDFSKCTYISWEKYEESPEIKIFEQDILMVKTGSSYGKSSIVTNLPEKATINPQLAVLKNILINRYYLNTVFQTQFARNQYEDFVLGTSIPTFSQEKLNNFILPLPPLAVQNAIVEKLEQVLPLVDAYENALLQKEELKNALPDKIKKAILQEAITGQLTESWRKSATIKESGKQLLDRIIEERNAKAIADWEKALKKNPKAKKPAPIVASEIEEDEIPFEIPESWCWCRWGELSELIQYGYNAPAKESGRIKMVRITDIQNGKVQWNTVPFCEISDTDIQVYQLRKNDILFARTGGTVGKSFLVDEEPENAVFAGYLIRTQYDDKKLNPKYMKMFMESQIYWDQLKNGTIATAQPNCNGQTLSKMILPLPPLEEQQEIVKKVEELLELCK